MKKLILLAIGLTLAMGFGGCGDKANPDPGMTTDDKQNNMNPAPAPGAGGNTPENTPKTEGM